MSALTPEAARAAAEWLESRSPSMAFDLRAEADRLEAAAKTAGQALAEHQGMTWLHVPPSFRVTYEDRAAAVIAHHVGPDRVVVDQADVKQAVDACALNGYTTTAIRLREALS